MNSFKMQWGLLFKVVIIAIGLMVLKGSFDYISFHVVIARDEWPRAVSALVGGVIFTIAIIFAGVLADYKESEKIPGELAGSIKALYSDCKVIPFNEKQHAEQLCSHIRELLATINANFRANTGDITTINAAPDAINDDVRRFTEAGLAPQFVVKLRTELTNINKISNRIKTVTETTFIPAAYGLAELAVAAVLVLLLFIRIEPYYSGLAIIGATAVLLIGILMLIKDMDNPFEVGKNTYADVDLSLLWNLEDDLKRE
jgi:hypothetical protein